MNKFMIEQLLKLGARRPVRDYKTERNAYLLRETRRKMGVLPGARRPRRRPFWCPVQTIRPRNYREIDFKSLGIRKRKAIEKDKKKYGAHQKAKREKMNIHGNRSSSTDQYDNTDFDVKSKIRCHKRISATQKRTLADDRVYYTAQQHTAYRGVTIAEFWDEI